MAVRSQLAAKLGDLSRSASTIARNAAFSAARSA